MHISLLLFLLCLSCLPPLPASLATLAITHATATTASGNVQTSLLVCALTVPFPNQPPFLNCTDFSSPRAIRIQPLHPRAFSFAGIYAGNGFISAAMTAFPSPTSVLVRWSFPTAAEAGGVGFETPYKRIYTGPALAGVGAGRSRVCGVVAGTKWVRCWHPLKDLDFGLNLSSVEVAVGDDFVCGILEGGSIKCVGNDSGVVGRVPAGNYSAVAAGSRRACAVAANGTLHCWGQLAADEEQRPRGPFTSMALGDDDGCALRPNGSAVCWGRRDVILPERLRETPFAAIEAKGGVFCGVLQANFSLSCWGDPKLDSKPIVFENVLPGPCSAMCRHSCSPLLDSDKLCGPGLSVCQPCVTTDPVGTCPQFPPHSPPQQGGGGSIQLDSRSVAFVVVGCAGFVSLAAVLGWAAIKYCRGGGVCRVHDSGRMEGDEDTGTDTGPAAAQPVLEKRLSHLISAGNGSHLEEFSLRDLLAATGDFSDERRVGTGSFGSVYRGTLADGREVAIKRAESSSLLGTKQHQQAEEDKDKAFLNELESLSRVNHKNLVRLLGFCEERGELALVYEYMKNGTLHDLLHGHGPPERRRQGPIPPLMTWTARLRVALQAAQGIEYLHEYTVPAVIHRDVKSANILLDSDWTAKVSDFGLSLVGPDPDKGESHLSLGAAGTVGYMDPEYYRLQQLTTKSDVYSFGVVLLELLSGQKAIHRNEDGVHRNVVDYVVPFVEQDQVHRVLDPRVPPPTPYEVEAVAYMGYLAVDCVTLAGPDRPNMSTVVHCLRKALATCLASPSDTVHRRV